MAGELHIGPDGSLSNGLGERLLSGTSYAWCTVLRRDGYPIQLPDELPSELVEVPRRPELLFSLLADTVAGELAIASLHATNAVGEETCDGLADKFGLGQLQQRNPLDLSGGEKARLGICIALLARPKVIVLDDTLEPIDAEARPQVVAALRGCNVRIIEIRATVPPAAFLGDVVVVAHDGRPAAMSPSEFGNRCNECHPCYPSPPATRVVSASDRPTPPVLLVTDLSHAYPGAFKLLPISLAARAGDIVRIAGRNGSGKTTLLKTLAQLILPDEGTVSINCPPRPQVLSYPQRKHTKGLARVLLYQFQDPSNQVYCATVRDELGETALRSHATTSRPVEAVAKELCLQEVMEISPWDLSEGQRRLMSLGSILCANPSVILADEPTAQLDGRQREVVARAFRRFTESGGVVLFIAHDELFSKAMATHTVYMPGERQACACLHEGVA